MLGAGVIPGGSSFGYVLDATRQPALTSVSIADLPSATTLTLDSFAHLTSVMVRNLSALTSARFTSLAALTSLDVTNFNLPRLTTFDVSNNFALHTLSGVTGASMPALATLYVHSNQLVVTDGDEFHTSLQRLVWARTVHPYSPMPALTSLNTTRTDTLQYAWYRRYSRWLEPWLCARCNTPTCIGECVNHRHAQRDQR